MSTAMIQLTDVPKVTGDPAALGEAAADLKKVATKVTTKTGAVTDAWKGFNEENYHTPEAPAVQQSIPMITSPMTSVSTNLTSVSTALTTASTSLTSLKSRSTSLRADVEDFIARAQAADAAVSGTVEATSGDDGPTGWRADPALVSENDRLWTRAGTLETDISQARTDLFSDIIGISAPDPVLPDPSFEAGVPSGNRASAEGPGASATTYAATTYKDGNWYAGAGAEADAHLFDLNANGSVATGYGTFAGSAGLYGGAKADASAKGSIGVDGIHGRAEANAFAGVEGTAKGSYNAGPLSAEVGVRGMAGAEANANAGIDVGLDGVSANAGVKAFAGAKAEVDGSVGLSGAKANVGADVRAGIGIEANADIAVTSDKVKVELDLGASLGVGAGVKVDLEIKPKEIVKDVAGFFGF